MGIMEKDVKDFQRWSNQPNGGQIDEREDQRPDQSQRNGNYGSDYAIEPESGGVEQQVSQAPNKLKALSGIRFSDHVFKENIDMLVHSLLIPVQYVQTNSEVRSAHIQRSLGRLLLHLLFLLLLLLFRKMSRSNGEVRHNLSQ